jgi:hypothetical protein
MMTLKQFGQTIKQKYPQYQKIDDEELGRKMIAKYPQYKDMVGENQGSTQTQQPQQSFLQKAGKVAGNVAQGAGEFLGMGALGKGLGLATFKLTPEGMQLSKKVNDGTANTDELEAYYAIFKDAPTPKQTIGSALQTATSFIPAGKIGKVSGAKTGLQAFTTGAIKSAIPAATTGAVYGAGQAMQEEKNIGGIAKSATIGGLTAGIISGVLGGLFAKKQFDAPKKASAIRDKAIEQYQSGLNTTKEKYKDKAQRIIPDLLDQGVWGSVNTLKKKAESGVNLSMDEYKKLGELKGIADTEGIEKLIANEMKKYVTPGGSVISVNQGKFKALQGLAEDIKTLKSDGIVENEELRKLAQQYGEVLYESRKAQKTINDNATLSQVKKVDSAIRELLNTTNPDYAKINQVYHLNSELQDILMETAKRKGGQKWFSLIKSVATAGGLSTGAVAGSSFGSGGAVAGSVIGGSALIGITTLLNSSWFNTLNALRKWRLADKISKLPLQDVPRTINALSAGGTKAVLDFLSDKNSQD